MPQARHDLLERPQLERLLQHRTARPPYELRGLLRRDVARRENDPLQNLGRDCRDVIVELDTSTNEAILLFGLFVAGTMALVMWRHRVNLAGGDLMHLIAADRVEPAPTRLPS